MQIAGEEHDRVEFLDRGHPPVVVAGEAEVRGVRGRLGPRVLFGAGRLLPHQTCMQIRDGTVPIVPVGRLQTPVLGVLAVERLPRLGSRNLCKIVVTPDLARIRDRALCPLNAGLRAG